MTAIHPVNGKKIRIIESEGCVWRDAKTLVWLDGSETHAKWNRYDVGVSSITDYNTVVGNGIEVDICIALNDGARNWILTKAYKNVRIFAVSRATIDELGPEYFVKERIDNMVCLEDAHTLYPILGATWDGTTEDARLMMALALQYKKTGPCQGASESPRLAYAKTLGLGVEAITSPSPLYFITQYFKSPKARRQAEIDHTLKQNAACPYIDKIVLLNEERYDIPIKSPRIEQHVIGHRLNFRTIIQYIQEKIPAGALVAIANADIYLDDSWRLLWSVDMRNKFLSLLRWDERESDDGSVVPPVLFGPRSDSQDTWVISADSVKERTWDWDSLDIQFGQNGCDNAINAEMLKNRFAVTNPCMSLITHHVHMSEFRTYQQLDILYRPVFMYLKPTGIHDLKPAYVLEGAPFDVVEVPVVKPPIRCPDPAVFRTMLVKDDETKSTVFPSYKTPLYTYENAFLTKDGLVQTYNSILVGPSKAVSDTWSSTETSVLAPCVAVDVGLAAFCPDSVASDPWRYMTQYLGKILHMRKSRGGGEFLGTEEMRGVLEKFSWRLDGDPKGKKEVPVLQREPGFQAWCSKVHVWYPQGGLKDMVTAQEVKVLRESVFRRRTTGGHYVFCLDDNWLTKDFVEAVEKSYGIDAVLIEPEDSVEEIMDLMTGAAGIIGLSGSAPLWGAWLLPPTAFVFEIQVASTPSVDIAHLCAVCEIDQYIHTVHRAVPQNKLDVGQVATELMSYVKRRQTKETVESKIYMPHPATKGFFAHAGDSFREMLAIWGEREYVTVNEVHGLANVWLGGVGKVLLYDRPTLEWYHASPEEEQTWTKALFGNPAPFGKNGYSWSFWPRRPRIVEELAAGLRPPFSERSRRVVFYGRSENAIQLRNRSKASWASACTEYVHLTGSDKYPYTHTEYLERLRGSLFGLCLAGYGRKCHREIECMAMGCVPCVAPEVDMSGYAVPPVEGVHYLRVSGPEDLARKTEAMGQAEWEAMSTAAFNWWKENASAEGMWRLTQRLANL
jgi:hypothetical protein